MNREQILIKKERNKIHARRVFVLLSFIAFIFLVTFFETKLNDKTVHDTESVLKSKKNDLAKVKNDNKLLKISVKELKSKDYIEKWIRSKYFYSKSGETIYNFDDK